MGEEQHPGGQDEGTVDGGRGLNEDGQGEVFPGGGGWVAAFCVHVHNAVWRNHQAGGGRSAGGLYEGEDRGGQVEEPG